MSNQEMQFSDPDWKPSQHLPMGESPQEQEEYRPRPLSTDPREQQQWNAAQEGYTQVPPNAKVAPQPSSRWRIWAIVALVLSTLVLIARLVLLGVHVFVNSSGPTSTMNTYCNALKSGDYQTAYHQFSSGLQSQIAEAQYATIYPSFAKLGLGKITNCAVSNVNNAAGSGTFSITFASGNTLDQDAALVNQNGSWQINGYQTHSSPALTLVIFCGDLLSQNYPAAYDQLSISQHNRQSEAQFANLFIRDTVSSCMVSNVNDTSGTGSITRTYANGSSNTFDYTLIDENGTWKINTRQLHP